LERGGRNGLGKTQPTWTKEGCKLKAQPGGNIFRSKEMPVHRTTQGRKWKTWGEAPKDRRKFEAIVKKKPFLEQQTKEDCQNQENSDYLGIQKKDGGGRDGNALVSKGRIGKTKDRNEFPQTPKARGAKELVEGRSPKGSMRHSTVWRNST